MLFWFCFYFELFIRKSLLSSFSSGDKTPLSFVIFFLLKRNEVFPVLLPSPTCFLVLKVNLGSPQRDEMVFCSPNAEKSPLMPLESHLGGTFLTSFIMTLQMGCMCYG